MGKYKKFHNWFNNHHGYTTNEILTLKEAGNLQIIRRVLHRISFKAYKRGIIDTNANVIKQCESCGRLISKKAVIIFSAVRTLYFCDDDCRKDFVKDISI